ncbi:MAG: glycosyltransferase [Saprospiraceae bacterium]|nr:glycosyltransferase [Saprospiraceae bacterium]
MKIAIIGPSYPYRGGIATYNERMALEFQEKGHEVTIFTFSLQYPNFLFPGKTQYSTNSQAPNVKIVRAINSVNPFNWITVGNRIKREKPDLVIVRFWLPFMGPCFGTILRRIKSNGHTKVLALVDNMIPHESRIGDTIFTKYFIGPIDGYVAMSKTVLKDIESFDNQKFKILTPHPLFDNFGETITREDAIKALGLDPNYRYMLFFGFIRKYKGLDLLLQAFADQRFRGKNIKLIVAGEYYVDKALYADLIKKSNLENSVVQFERFIKDSEVKNFFCASDLIVQPYRSATQSGVTQIAYHFNKPMVVTNVGGLPELCPHEKVGYITTTEPNDIGDAILRFFEGDKNKFEANILEEKKKYSWDILIQNILKAADNS